MSDKAQDLSETDWEGEGGATEPAPRPTWSEVQAWPVDAFLAAWGAGDLKHLGLLPPGPIIGDDPA
jgi:hypothetical protein